MNINNFFVWRKDADHCLKPFLQQPGFLRQTAGTQAALKHYVVQIWSDILINGFLANFQKSIAKWSMHRHEADYGLRNQLKLWQESGNEKRKKIHQLKLLWNIVIRLSPCHKQVYFLPGIEFIYCQRKNRARNRKTIPPKFKRNIAEILGG